MQFKMVYLTNEENPSITRQTTMTLLSKQNSMHFNDISIHAAIQKAATINRNSMLGTYYKHPPVSDSSQSTNHEKFSSRHSSGPKFSMATGRSSDSIFTNEALNAKMKYAFTSTQDDELSVEKNDEVEILQTLENGWTYAKSNGREGLVPTSYLEVM